MAVWVPKSGVAETGLAAAKRILHTDMSRYGRVREGKAALFGLADTLCRDKQLPDRVDEQVELLYVYSRARVFHTELFTLLQAVGARRESTLTAKQAAQILSVKAGVARQDTSRRGTRMLFLRCLGDDQALPGVAMALSAILKLGAYSHDSHTAALAACVRRVGTAAEAAQSPATFVGLFTELAKLVQSHSLAESVLGEVLLGLYPVLLRSAVGATPAEHLPSTLSQCLCGISFFCNVVFDSPSLRPALKKLSVRGFPDVFGMLTTAVVDAVEAGGRATLGDLHLMVVAVERSTSSGAIDPQHALQCFERLFPSVFRGDYAPKRWAEVLPVPYCVSLLHFVVMSKAVEQLPLHKLPPDASQFDGMLAKMNSMVLNKLLLLYSGPVAKARRRKLEEVEKAAAVANAVPVVGDGRFHDIIFQSRATADLRRRFVSGTQRAEELRRRREARLQNAEVPSAPPLGQGVEVPAATAVASDRESGGLFSDPFLTDVLALESVADSTGLDAVLAKTDTSRAPAPSPSPPPQASTVDTAADAAVAPATGAGYLAESLGAMGDGLDAEPDDYGDGGQQLFGAPCAAAATAEGSSGDDGGGFPAGGELAVLSRIPAEIAGEATVRSVLSEDEAVLLPEVAAQAVTALLALNRVVVEPDTSRRRRDTAAAVAAATHGAVDGETLLAMCEAMVVENRATFNGSEIRRVVRGFGQVRRRTSRVADVVAAVAIRCVDEMSPHMMAQCRIFLARYMRQMYRDGGPPPSVAVAAAQRLLLTRIADGVERINDGNLRVAVASVALMPGAAEAAPAQEEELRALLAEAVKRAEAGTLLIGHVVKMFNDFTRIGVRAEQLATAVSLLLTQNRPEVLINYLALDDALGLVASLRRYGLGERHLPVLCASVDAILALVVHKRRYMSPSDTSFVLETLQRATLSSDAVFDRASKVLMGRDSAKMVKAADSFGSTD